MKKQICVNVDIEYLLNAKQKVGNVSEYLNECLKGLSGKSNTEIKEEELLSQIETIQNTIQELSIKKSIIEMDLKILKEKISEQKKIIIENEKYKRWKCPICKHNNFLDNERCVSCNLPTKKDKKTLFITVDENNNEKVE